MRTKKIRISCETLELISALIKAALAALEKGEQYDGRDPKEVLMNLANALEALAVKK